MQIFSVLRAMRAVTPGRILLVTQKELSAVVAECTVRTERAAASVEESVARAEAARADIQVLRLGLEVARLKQEEAVAKQEEAIAKQEALTARLEQQWADADARWQEERVALRRSGERQEKMVQEYARQTDRVIAEFDDARDERRALLEALFRVMDRLPPPPPDLRSA
ncbi:MAG TPA: hypothetical protein VFN92_05455 [Solirubrobacterales bacterium]|nr:hypothetical protein [Solirubrobacterales bacterium]